MMGCRKTHHLLLPPYPHLGIAITARKLQHAADKNKKKTKAPRTIKLRFAFVVDVVVGEFGEGRFICEGAEQKSNEFHDALLLHDCCPGVRVLCKTTFLFFWQRALSFSLSPSSIVKLCPRVFRSPHLRRRIGSFASLAFF
mmetsp:Transcript_11107/g.22419  ORF Transcript_11107/g.22419 Transcript_11107/m.22419 type:complete len:141 (+) Transcript_11107:183-605(+)